MAEITFDRVSEILVGLGFRMVDGPEVEHYDYNFAMLNFPEEHFDGILVWDTLQFLSAPLLETVMARLHGMLQPGGYMLAIFNAQEQAGPIPTYSFRITDNRTMGLAPRGQRAAAQFFNNRSLERLFEGFDSVKFFLTRDHLREVIVRR